MGEAEVEEETSRSAVKWQPWNDDDGDDDDRVDGGQCALR